MRVVVTGGTGFLGANVVRHLLHRGDEVRCLVRPTSPSLTLDGLDVDRVAVDATDAQALRPVLAEVDAVIHVAGIFDPGPGGAERMRRIHVDATEALCAAAAEAGVKRVVLCSSSITVGFGPREAPGDECTTLDADRIYGKTGALRVYHDTKLAQEQAGRTWTSRGLPVVTVNPDYVIGAWDIKPTSGTLIVQMARHWVPLWPRGGKCFVDADDCAAAHLLALERGTPGERYLLGAHNRSYRELMGLIAEVVGQRPPVAPVPRTLMHAAGLVGRLATRVAPHRAAGLEPRVLTSMQQGRYRSGRRAIVELGMPVTPLQDSVRKAFQWFVEHGYCPARGRR